MNSTLVKVFGWPMPLFHADTAVLDRWLWLRKRLPSTSNRKMLLDVGCGSGAFTIGAALRGYSALGLSWDTRNQNVAIERARMCNAKTAEFQIQDIRELGERDDLFGRFDVAICCEAIEHIIDDEKLMRDIAKCLTPSGRLLLTTTNYYLKPIDPAHEGPFPTVENGGHVRKGYTPEGLLRLCDGAGLKPESISYCTGFVSQKITHLHFVTRKVHSAFAWLVVNPFRIFPPLLDDVVTRWLRYPHYSICLEASKPD
jgi:2-polyprenyl-3-methyl-5-hydroxy-6-metoxy-1,4-benzoquinol methylase